MWPNILRAIDQTWYIFMGHSDRICHVTGVFPVGMGRVKFFAKEKSDGLSSFGSLG